MSLLVTIEGIDGSGKSTLIKGLQKNSELDLITHNWRDTELGQKIWHLINETRAEGKNSLPSTWTYIFLIFSAFDELNRKVIEPGLRENKVVIIDRYIDSTFIYQGLEGGTGVNIVREIAKKTIDLPFPDVTFVLDIDPQQAQERLKKRKLATGEYTNWDNLKLEFHHRIRNYYLELKKIFPERIYLVDAEQSENEILKEVQTIIKKCLPEKTEKNDLPTFSRVIIQNEKGEFLLVKDKKWGWNFPGGKIERGETPELAAKREVFEETNLLVQDLKQTGESFLLNIDNDWWKCHIYQAGKYSGKLQAKEKKKGSVIETKFFSEEEMSKIKLGGATKYFFEKKVSILPRNKTITFQNVSFTYPGTNKKVLDNFSFTFQSGKKYTIIGPNGVGKSTLFKLLVKLYRPQKGVIKLDNTDLEKFDNSALRSKIAYLPNNPSFFNASLGDNIVYPKAYRENIHKEKLEKIAKNLGVEEFVDKLPSRWETTIEEKGQNLSEGQKQMVSLMRAFVRDYEIYLFDEFLSNVSSELKKKILKIIFSELKNKTIIFTGHDGEALQYADEIYKFTSRGIIKVN